MKLKFVSVGLGVLAGTLAHAQLLTNVSSSTFVFMHDHSEFVDAAGVPGVVNDFTRMDFKGLNQFAIVSTSNVVG